MRAREFISEELSEAGRALTVSQDMLTNVKKLWQFINRNLYDLAIMANSEGKQSKPYIDERLESLLHTADGQPVIIAFDMGSGIEFDNGVLYIPIVTMWRYRSIIIRERFIKDVMSALGYQTSVREDWQKANKRDKTDGMSQKAVNAYRRENPGSKLQTAVTTKPSKLKKGSKASKRRKSYCSRSKGQMDMHNISCAKDPDKAICKARRRWNC